MPRQDNSTLTEKVALRKNALRRLSEMGVEAPVVLETHGGEGKLFDACYATLKEGVVFETDNRKVAILAKQRPTWAVYQADCEVALQGGAGGHLEIDLLDLDPYGQPWPAIEAFFGSQRPFKDLMVVAVNDGLRQKLAMGGAWDVGSLQDVVERRGNDLHPVYLEVCRELLAEKAALAGYQLCHFAGYYCGQNKAMTHYLGVLQRSAS